MKIHTTRFGAVDFDSEDIIVFPSGILGLEHCRQWVLLADSQNDALGWLQSTSRPEIALAVVSPRRFVPGYQIRVSRCEIEPLALPDSRQAQVLAILANNEGSLTLNLKAPLVINLQRRLGRQVVTNGDHPLQYELVGQRLLLKKSA